MLVWVRVRVSRTRVRVSRVSRVRTRVRVGSRITRVRVRGE